MSARIAAWLAVELALLAVLARQPGWSALFGIGHALVAAATLVEVRRAATLVSAPGGTLLWIGAAAGPAGVLAARIAMIVGGMFRTRLPLSGPVEAGGRAPADPAITLERLLDKRAAPPAAALIGRLDRVLRHGSLADRQAAIEMVVRSFEPRLTPVIVLALADRDQTIRALAASASARIAQVFASTQRRLEQRAQASERADDHLALATLLSVHARFNVLFSDAQRSRLGEGAAAALARAQALTGARATPLATGIGRLVQARDWAGLAALCSGPQAPAQAPDDATRDIVDFWRAEAAH